jgi:23S rRNA-/tRNA-specific pseudouridylate synthase
MSRLISMLQLSIQEPYIFLAKPAGIPSHAPNKGETGLVEELSHYLKRPVYLVHRLDSATSGAMVMALSSQSAANLALLFERRLVHKRYCLVSDRPIPSQFPFGYSSHITKRRGRLVSWPRSDVPSRAVPNAFSVFYPVARVAAYTRLEVELLSGKSHQIRLHAKDLGFSLLGDDVHGGTKFSRLMLHATTLSWEEAPGVAAAAWQVQPPLPFMKLELCEDPAQARALLAESIFTES